MGLGCCGVSRRSYQNGAAQDWNGIPGQWWFGGGTDITPAYLDADDMRHFHGCYKVPIMLVICDCASTHVLPFLEVGGGRCHAQMQHWCVQ